MSVQLLFFDLNEILFLRTCVLQHEGKLCCRWLKSPSLLHTLMRVGWAAVVLRAVCAGRAQRYGGGPWLYKATKTGSKPDLWRWSFSVSAPRFSLEQAICLYWLMKFSVFWPDNSVLSVYSDLQEKFCQNWFVEKNEKLNESMCRRVFVPSWIIRLLRSLLSEFTLRIFSF